MRPYENRAYNPFMQQRRLEIDLLRTLAILMMIVYHAAFDLRAFYGWDIDVLHGVWWRLARSTATLFLVLVGASFVLSWHRWATPRGRSRPAPTEMMHDMYPKYFRRAMFILACAMLVTLVTYFFDPHTYVRFGILHLIAVSTLLLPLFIFFKEWNVLIGAIVVAIGMLIKGTIVPTPILLPFGFLPPNFDTIDYFPLLPWLGLVLMGMGLGHFFYVRQKIPLIPHSDGKYWKWLTFTGRHAFIIYLLHYPILVVILLMTEQIGF